ncbi:hypothetical protein [Microbacterium sp. USTB-Y]|uniref:hypothetical protein n=1 Tax=Microbacterium sp. USTB-Y TaxID=2823692 RepID=UPI00203ACB76|nr:hypothetical protein [Microbacterium sp. USTB-Y]
MRLLHTSILAIVVGALLGLGSAFLDGLFSGVLGGSLVPILFACGVGWAGSGYYLSMIARRKLTPEEAGERAIYVAQHAVAMALAGECVAAIPQRNGHVCLCVRSWEHIGPHQCGICEEVTR